VLPLRETAPAIVALELIGPLNAVALAVMMAVPAPTAITSPVDPTVATAGVLELQVTKFVTFWVDGWFALPNVPVAVSWVVCPTISDWLFGVTTIESSPEGFEHPTAAMRQSGSSAAKKRRSGMTGLQAKKLAITQAMDGISPYGNRGVARFRGRGTIHAANHPDTLQRDAYS